MRTVVLMFFMLSVIVPNAFGAGVRAVRGAVNNNATYDISTEKSVDSETVRSARQSRVQTVAPSSVSVRSATRTSVRSGGISSSQSQQNFAQSVRAAKKQSAINIGTKVLEATVNTTMPQECVSAYNGCMDSFCVIPNTSGGRCRCDNRVFNFDKISDKIKQFDRNSEAIATDGSKLLNLGKTADDIYSMADEAEKKVMQEQDEYVSDFFDNSLNKKNKKSATLDMSLLGTSDLFDANSDFDENLEAKYGDSLHKYADGLCVEQMPETCEKYILLLKTAYTNQINGDCKAYENDLRKKSVNSEQSKQQAKSELRAAALERYNEDNKYTFAGCVREIKHCMMKNDNCGPGFKKCVYDPIMLKKASDKTRKKKIKIAGGASIEIAAVNATIDTGVFKNMMTVEFCNGDKCDADLSKFDDYKEILAGNVSPQVKGKMDLSVMQYSIPTDSNSYDVFFVDGTDVEGADSLANIKTLLNTAYSDMIKAIESDAKVNYCMYGRNTKGINDTHWISKASKDKTNANYPSLTNGTRNTVAQYLLNSLSESYYAAYEDKVETEVKGAIAKISSTLTRLKGTLDEAKKIQQVINENVCKRLTYKNEGSRHGCNGYWDNVSSYDKFTSVCTVKITRYTKGCCGWFCDFDIDWTKTRKYQMPIITQEEMEKAGGDISKATTDEADIIKNTLDGDAKLSDE